MTDTKNITIMTGPRFYNRAGLCEVLNLGMVTVDKLLRRKVNPIPSLRVGHKILIPCDMFDEWVRNESNKNNAEKFKLLNEEDDEEDFK